MCGRESPLEVTPLKSLRLNLPIPLGWRKYYGRPPITGASGVLPVPRSSPVGLDGREVTKRCPFGRVWSHKEAWGGVDVLLPALPARSTSAACLNLPFGELLGPEEGTSFSSPPVYLVTRQLSCRKASFLEKVFLIKVQRCSKFLKPNSKDSRLN